MRAHRITGIVALVLALSAGGVADGHSRAARLSAGRQVVRLGPLGRAVPPSFIGLSVETNELRAFEHRVPAFGRFLSLLRAPGQGPVILRIGGESADTSYFTGGGFRAPPGQISLDANWLAGMAALVGAAHLHVILDLNAAAHSPRMAGVLANAARRALPPGSLQAFEIGNEPDLYHDGLIGLKRYRNGWPPDVAWAATYAPQDYAREFDDYGNAIRKAAPDVPLAGPAAAGWGDSWVAGLIAHARVAPGLITTHRYPLSACAPVSSSHFPTVARVLSDSSSDAVARSVVSDVARANAVGVGVRVTELGIAVCGGTHGVTDVLADALWIPDVLFGVMQNGVAGVNIHARFAYPNSALRGNAARPAQAIFYGMLAFTRMLGPGAKLKAVIVSGAPYRRLVVWAVHLRDGTVNMLVENKGSIPASTLLELGARAPASIQWLSAPSPASTAVSLGGQTLDSSGHWQGPPSTTALAPHRGTYALAVPPYSAALVSVPAP